jgi:hypothetical protein
MIRQAVKGKLKTSKHGGSAAIMYLEVTPSGDITHLRWNDETFPRPADWSLADIWEYARLRKVQQVRIAQHLSNGATIRGAMHITDWVMTLHAQGANIGIVTDAHHHTEEV